MLCVHPHSRALRAPPLSRAGQNQWRAPICAQDSRNCAELTILELQGDPERYLRRDFGLLAGTSAVSEAVGRGAGAHSSMTCSAAAHKLCVVAPRRARSSQPGSESAGRKRLARSPPRRPLLARLRQHPRPSPAGQKERALSRASNYGGRGTVEPARAVAARA
jgi:hypothetical protein